MITSSFTSKVGLLWKLVFSLFGVVWGVAFPNQSNTTKLARLFHWKEERESLKCCISLFVLNYLEREIE